MPLFGRRRVKASADEIAELLLSEFVANEDLCPTPQMTLTEDQTDAYRAKCRLYRLALVLMAVLGDEHRNPKLSEVRDSLERRVFGVRDERSEALLQRLGGAMSDLRSLLFREGKPTELSWARSWLAGAGIVAINPVDLSLFASNWMLQYTAAVKSLRDFRIT